MRRLVLLLTVVSLGFAPAPFLAPRQGTSAADLQAIQGLWHTHFFSLNGDVIEPNASFSTEISGTLLTERINGDIDSRWTVTLDTSSSPGLMDKVKEVTDTRRAFRRECRYRIAGDPLTVCWSGTEASRPAGLAPGAGIVVQILKRTKL